jgi:hypothetical protein
MDTVPVAVLTSEINASHSREGQGSSSERSVGLAHPMSSVYII